MRLTGSANCNCQYVAEEDHTQPNWFSLLLSLEKIQKSSSSRRTERRNDKDLKKRRYIGFVFRDRHEGGYIDGFRVIVFKRL